MLTCVSLWRARINVARSVSRPISKARFYSLDTVEPLNILFCGSDEISVACLQALEDERKRDPALINSIEVICKSGKPVGRGLKEIRDVPLKSYATDLGLKVHEISTFTKWTPPSLANLSADLSAKSNIIIAVSFGLFVPPRILNSLRYGGLNVHGSLLPDLRGAAPLEWALLLGRQSSGATLQTLHPEHFDHGVRLAQRKFRFPRDGSCSIEELRTYAAPVMAELLVQGLRDGLHKSPVEADRKYNHAASEAPKVGQDHACVDWSVWRASRILRTQRVLSLWSKCTTGAVSKSSREDRVKWYGIEDIGPVPGSGAGDQPAIRPGEIVIAHFERSRGSVTLEYSGLTQTIQPRPGSELESSLIKLSGTPAVRSKFGLVCSADERLLFPQKIQMAGGKQMDNRVALSALQRLTLLPNANPAW